MKKIVIVEDDVWMREALADILEREGYSTSSLEAFEDAAAQIFDFAPSLVLLDLNLPGTSGFEICRALRRKSLVPIVVLTSREQLKDELQALDLGADEYLTKPFRKERLLARISNVLKRHEGRENMIEGVGFLLDRNTYTLYLGNRSTVLPGNQGKLLETLLTSDSAVVKKAELSMSLWGTTEFIDENALQVNIARLKKTMQELGLPYRILSVRGVGYSLQVEE